VWLLRLHSIISITKQQKKRLEEIENWWKT
jgi:hypothetical protein